MIDEVLADPTSVLSAKSVSKSISKAFRSVKLFATEDRDRVKEYMVEIWYILGFKGATGLFAYGSAYNIPEGYGEPLPPGWLSPTQPRNIATAP